MQERGRERLLGPMDFTTNDECGLLIEGYERRPMILEPWHPPYYRERIEAHGYGKTMDLLMWYLRMGRLKEGDSSSPRDPRGRRQGRVRARDHGSQHAQAGISRPRSAKFMEVYNSAWERNWGFVPITDEEIPFQAKALKQILDERWAFIAERDGEVLGAALTLPDINQVLPKLNGRLLPFGWLRFLLGKRRIDRVRVFALGVKPEYQHPASPPASTSGTWRRPTPRA